MPLAPGLGYKSFLLIGKETVYGTPPAACNAKCELLSHSFNANLGTIDDPSMTSTQLSRRAIGQGGQFVSGSVRVRLNYEGHEHIWRLLLKTNAKTGTGPWVYTFKEAADATLASFTLDVGYGDVPTGKVTRFAGCFVTGFRISGQAVGTGEGGFLTADIDFVAATATENTTPMTGGSFPSPQGVQFHHLLRTAGNFKDGSGAVSEADIMLRSFTLTASIPHDTERFYFGSVNAEFPIRNGPLDITFEFEEEWNSVLLMQKARANTMTGLKLYFRGALISGVDYRELILEANAPTASLYNTDIAGFGAIMHRAGYRLAYSVADSSAVVVTTKNNINLTDL